MQFAACEEGEAADLWFTRLPVPYLQLTAFQDMTFDRDRPK